jgi:hypothetical protein
MTEETDKNTKFKTTKRIFSKNIYLVIMSKILRHFSLKWQGNFYNNECL